MYACLPCLVFIKDKSIILNISNMVDYPLNISFFGISQDDTLKKGVILFCVHIDQNL